MSERKACQLAKQPRGTQRYQPIQREDEDDLAQSVQPQAEDPGRPPAAPLPPPLESRTSLCLDAELPPPGDAMGIPHRNFLGFVQLACLLMLLRHL